MTCSNEIEAARVIVAAALGVGIFAGTWGVLGWLRVAYGCWPWDYSSTAYRIAVRTVEACDGR